MHHGDTARSRGCGADKPLFFPQLGAIRKTCKNAEFVFLEPPIIVQKADMPWAQTSLDEFASNATTETEQQTPETTPRAWWLTGGDKSVYKSEHAEVHRLRRPADLYRV